MTSDILRRGLQLAVLIGLLLSSRLEARPLYNTLFHAFDYGSTAIGVRLEDLDGDGKLDIVAPLYLEATVLVRLGDGEGDFGRATFLPLPGLPSAFAVARLNLDDHPDLLIASGPGTLSVFYGSGDGNFGPRVDFAIGGNPGGVAVGDVNEDGRADVAVTSGTAAQVRILFGFMDTFFYPTLDLPTGSGSAAVALRDVDGDTHLDVVVLNRGAATIAIFLGDGAGDFAAPATLSAPTSARDMTIEDLNGDALPDIAVTASATGEVWVYLGTGSGSFATPSPYPANGTPSGLVASTVNGDSIPDLLVANTTPNAVSVLPGNGDGSFAAPVSVQTEVSPTGVAAGDLNGDGAMDFAAANAKAISIHLGNGDLSFGSQENTYEVGPGHKVIAVADLDHDGTLDLAITSWTGYTLSLRFGRGDCTFETGPRLSTPAGPQGLAVGDINEDGFEDVVTVNSTANSYTRFLGTGLRTWAPGVSTPLATDPFICELRDLNADDHLDMIVLKREWVNVFLGSGSGEFPTYTSYRVTDSWPTSALEIADLNGDGALDLVAAQYGCCPGRMWVLLGNGDGTFQERSLVWESPGTWAMALAAGMLGSDDNLDVATGVVGAGLGLLPGDGGGGFGPMMAVDTAYKPVWLEVGDVNQDGAEDIVGASRDFPWMISAHIGHQDGTFLPRLDFGIGGGATCVKIADLDQDGDADLVVGDTDSYLVWVLASQRAIPTDTPELPAVSGTQPRLVASERADGQVRIAYALALGATPVELAVYDVRGRLVRTLLPGAGDPGQNLWVWDRRDTRGARVGRGIYFVRLGTPHAKATCKLVLVRR